MAGGPVNGAPWYGALSLIGGAGIASAASRGRDSKNPTGIVVPTVIQMAADALRYWTSMTCIYDRHWTSDPDRVTLPICMFHVKKIVPTYVNEVSKKRVILYEPEGELATAEAADQMRRGVMQTIVDNVVKQPTTYNAEVIVPFQPIGRYVTQGVKTVSDIVMAFSDLFGKSSSGGFGDWWEGIFSTAFSQAKLGNQAMQLAGMLPNMNGLSYINVNSLEAMASSGRLLCMKMWTGYDYKFVVITGLTLDKQPLEDDVFRATLALQEMPVLIVTKPASPRPHVTNRNWAVSAVSMAHSSAVRPLITMTDVKYASGETETGLASNTKTLITNIGDKIKNVGNVFGGR
jgi:hypothetical protein